jgi:hypothetical protein
MYISDPIQKKLLWVLKFIPYSCAFLNSVQIIVLL